MSRARVLLLEDDSTLRAVMIDVLVEEGYEVEPADSFAALRERAAQSGGDVVVADYWGTGYTHLLESDREELRALNSQLPVVLVTGRAWAAQVTADEACVTMLLRKPFDLLALLKALEICLPGRS